MQFLVWSIQIPKKKSLGTPLLFLNLTIGQLGFIDVN